MFKSYPTLSDPGLFTAMYALFPEIVPGKQSLLSSRSILISPLTLPLSELRHPLPTVMLHVHAALLLPLFFHLWTGQGSGNANFFYAATLVFGIANGAGIVDALRAGLRMGFGKREGWELVQS